MSAKSMDVVSLRDTVVCEYRRCARLFTTVHAEGIGQRVEAICGERGANVAGILTRGSLDSRTAEISR